MLLYLLQSVGLIYARYICMVPSMKVCVADGCKNTFSQSVAAVEGAIVLQTPGMEPIVEDIRNLEVAQKASVAGKKPL